jgi:hypothetical protein
MFFFHSYCYTDVGIFSTAMQDMGISSTAIAIQDMRIFFKLTS